jgi:hypothetical protein
MDKFNNPVRDAEGNLVFVEKVIMPSERALEFELDRLDPVEGLRLDMQPAIPGRTAAEQLAVDAEYFEPFLEGIRTLLNLGVPLPEIAEQRQLPAPERAIEITAVKVPSNGANGTGNGRGA